MTALDGTFFKLFFIAKEERQSSSSVKCVVKFTLMLLIINKLEFGVAA